MTALPVEASEMVDRYATSVGFRRADGLPILADTPEPPPGAQLWTSKYAQVLLWPTPSSQQSDIADAAESGQAWLDMSLSRAEAEEDRPAVVDGYVVVLLPETPKGDALTRVREIEQDSCVCRKHVVWRRADEDEERKWERLLRVTALGLPESPEASERPEEPDYAADETGLLDELGSASSPGRLAENHLEGRTG